MFTVKMKSGTYKVRMRPRYATIKSEKKLLERIQESIDWQREKGYYSTAVADRYQELLDERDIMRIASDWGMFNWTQRIKP